MNDLPDTIVPRGRRDQIPPSAPLDPYVTELLQWIQSRDNRLNLNTIATQAAKDLGWPGPFAEAVVTATRARRLFTFYQVNARGGYGVGLSEGGRAWLERATVTDDTVV